MKIAIVNGSARKGNTLAAIEVFSEGAKTKNEILLMEKNMIA